MKCKKLRFAGVHGLLFRILRWNCELGWNCGGSLITPETMKSWVGVQKSLSFKFGCGFLALVGNLSSDGCPKAAPCTVDYQLCWTALHHIFVYWVR